MKALKKLIHRVHFRGELLHNENRSYVALYVDNYLLKSLLLQKFWKMFAITSLCSKVFQYAKAIFVEQISK